jgi:ABC-type sugar transport system, periplasmic component
MKKKAGLICLLILCCVSLVFAQGNTEKASSANAEKIELVYWSNWNETEPQGVVISSAIKEFQKLHPEVKITAVWNGRENRKILLPALESGKQVDFFEQTTDLVLGKLQNYLLDLTPYFEKTYDTTGGKPYIQTLMPAAVNLVKSFSPNGDQLFAVPYQPNIMMVFYNKDHFEKAGITKTPETWTEFLDVCEKLKQAGYTPMTCDDAYLLNLIGAHIERIKGVDWLKANINNPSVVFSDSEVLKGFEDLKSMMDAGYFSEYILSNKYPAGQQDMALNDKISMYYNGSWLPNELKGSTGPDYNWGAFNYPVVNPSASNAGHVQYNSQALAINKNCQHPEVAFEFAVFLTSAQWDKKLAEDTLGIPVSVGMEWPKQLEEAKPVFEQITYRVPGDYGLFSVPEYNPLIIEAFIDILQGKLTPAQAMEKLSKL